MHRYKMLRLLVPLPLLRYMQLAIKYSAKCLLNWKLKNKEQNTSAHNRTASRRRLQRMGRPRGGMNGTARQKETESQHEHIVCLCNIGAHVFADIILTVHRTKISRRCVCVVVLHSHNHHTHTNTQAHSRLHALL